MVNELQSHLAKLARNNLWSNHRIYTACGLLTQSEYFAKRQSYFGSIHATLNHILVVDLLYLGRLKYDERAHLECDEIHPTLQALYESQRLVDRELVTFCEWQTSSSLKSIVVFTNSAGGEYSEMVSSVLTHLFIHQIHHRGQVHSMLSQTPVEPPQLDEFFLNGDLELRDQELKLLQLPRE